MSQRALPDLALAHMSAPTPFQIIVLHMNDVYNLEERTNQDQCGGAARFTSMVRAYERLCSSSTPISTPPLLLCSGDVINPSLMGVVLRGKQMVPIINEMGLKCCAIGNHDLDLGVPHLEKLMTKSKFPWIISNCKERGSERPLAGGKEYVLLDWFGRKIGLIGMIEDEWLQTLATVDPDELLYEDFCKSARRLVPQMKAQGADIIIALTHMRVPNDKKFAEECGDIIDLFLGGHDHHYEVMIVPPNNRYVFKSGTDFQDLSAIKIEFSDNSRPNVVEHYHEKITVSVPPDLRVSQMVNEFNQLVGKKMDKVLGYIQGQPWDARFTSVRTQETNVGNFVMDVLRMGVTPPADVAFINSGTLRADTIIQPGPFRCRDLVTLLPMLDETIVLSMPGFALLEAMENGVSQYPKLEGRFPQVSGIKFAFDPSRPAMSRIPVDSVYIQGKPIELQKKYRVITKEYLYENRDGFRFGDHSEVLINGECSPMLPTLIRNYFVQMRVLNKIKTDKTVKEALVFTAFRKWELKAEIRSIEAELAKEENMKQLLRDDGHDSKQTPQPASSLDDDVSDDLSSASNPDVGNEFDEGDDAFVASIMGHPSFRKLPSCLFVESRFGVTAQLEGRIQLVKS